MCTHGFYLFFFIKRLLFRTQWICWGLFYFKVCRRECKSFASWVHLKAPFARNGCQHTESIWKRKRPTIERMRVSVLAATLLHNSQAACVSNGRLITHSPHNLSRMQMWLLTCNAIVELPHNALCIYNAPLWEFADLIGTLLRITSCMVFFPPAPSLCRNQKGAGWLRWYRPSPSARAAAPAQCVLMLNFSAVQVMHQQKQRLEETTRQRRHCVG